MKASDQIRTIDEPLVRALVDGQFPRWSDLPLRRTLSAGTDNAIFRLGEGLAVRLPMRESAAPQAEREQRWLPRLAPALPLEIPTPVAAGRPGEAYPWAWSVCPWMAGVDAAAAPPLDLTQAGRDLGEFVAALGRIDASGGPAAGRANKGRGLPLALLGERVRADIAALGAEINGAAVLDAWEEAVAAPAHRGHGTWIHGDLHPSNLLVRDGRIAGVLDFGLLGVGDPACDLFVAWSYLDGPARRVFQHATEAGEAAWLRGRGWAIFSAVIALAFHLHSNPTLCAMSRRTLAEVLR